MALLFTRSKRAYENNLEPNGKKKWQKTAPLSVTQQNQLKVPPGSIVFRLLCPSSKFGSIIGKGGEIVAKIRKETGAKVSIEKAVPGCDDRVVVITGLEKEAEHSKEEGSKEDNDEIGAADGGDEETKVKDDNDEEKVGSSTLEGPKSEKPLSPAQKALLLVYERLVAEEPGEDGGDDESKKSSPISVKLLIVPKEIGCLLGEDGSVMKQLSSNSGAEIQLLPKDALPLCAIPTDKIFQINGGVDSARKALQSISQLLLENPSRERVPFPPVIPSEPSSLPIASFPRPGMVPPANSFPSAQGPPFPSKPFDSADYHSKIRQSFSNFHEGAVPGPILVPPETITYRLLCSNDKVGSIIGTGGSVIKTLQRETGCAIKVHETVPESEDRIVVISGPVIPGDRICPAQNAVLRVQERIGMAALDNKESTLLARLLLSSDQTGCLIGKGGAIIAEMRKLSGARIRILGKDQIPKSVPENDEVVQVTGELRTVQDALFQITTRLKHLLFRDKLPPMNHTAYPPHQMPPLGPYVGRREPSPPRLYPNIPLPFQNDSSGRIHEERPRFHHAMNVPPHGIERLPPAPWARQDMREGDGSMPTPDFVGGMPQRRIAGFPSGNQSAVINNTTVDVVVPQALVASIYGEDGFCLRRIQEISDAKITITEPRPEATETVIVITGTPEQTHAAQSLLQAFVLSESGTP